jgi:polysaccharide biosynthesis/export protein
MIVKFRLRSRNLPLLMMFLLLIVLSSCFEKRVMYIQPQEGEKDTGVLYRTHKPEYRLKVNDVLYIRLVSENEEIADVINNQFQSSGNQGRSSMGTGSQGAGFYLSGYHINDTGYVDVPILGPVKVVNKTMDEVRELVQQRTDRVFRGVKAVVKLVSFRIVFMGEIGPTVKYFYQEEVNVIEALASVGGVSNFGKRHNILVLRKTDEGYETYRIDITKRNIIESEHFYLHPNDIVYIEPIATKGFRVGITDYMFVLSTITSILTTILLYVKL